MNGFMFGLMWLVAIVVFLLLEAATYQFICIWFAGGALGSLIAYGLGFSLDVQISVFFVLSAVLLILTRPFVKKLVGSRRIKTNVDTIPGQTAIVTEKIDNLNNLGAVKLGSLTWAARSSDGSVIEKNEQVIIKEVSGVKVIVEKKS